MTGDVRCPECRKARKDKAAAQTANPRPSQDVGASGDFAGPPRERRGGGGGSGSRRRGGFGVEAAIMKAGTVPAASAAATAEPRAARGRASRAVCAACGAKTTVPFEPTQGRDVYCRACSQKSKGF